MGRGQQPCDGTTGSICVPANPDSDASDGSCECADCAWDKTDCKVTTSKCNGSAVSSCCASANPCKLQPDGVCECGDWCTWDTQDCN